ncbi:hypothetical protein ACIQC7_34440 [Kitasatospora sp. NPDC088556]|uniref:hypothetical protein n=1 Tax=Kitasatospora sp. NPDC088556 TaxID=3364076 RepID=UPI00381DBB55
MERNRTDVQPDALFGQLAVDGGPDQCREWAEHLTAWAEQRIGAVPRREEVVRRLADSLHRFPRRPGAHGSPLLAVSLEEAAAAAGDDGVAGQVGRVLACHREDMPPGATPVVDARRHALAQMLRERSDGGVPEALTGSTVLNGQVSPWLTAVVVDGGPSAAPIVHLSLYPVFEDVPHGGGDPDGWDDTVVSFGLTAAGPGVADGLHEGAAYGRLLAALPGLDSVPAEIPLGRLLYRLLADDIVGVVSPRRCAVLLARGVRRSDWSWQPLLAELETDEEGQSVWAGPALCAWTTWAALRRWGLTKPTGGAARVRVRPDAVLPHAGAVQVVAPDGTRSTATITASRLVDWQAPPRRRLPWE